MHRPKRTRLQWALVTGAAAMAWSVGCGSSYSRVVHPAPPPGPDANGNVVYGYTGTTGDANSEELWVLSRLDEDGAQEPLSKP